MWELNWRILKYNIIIFRRIVFFLIYYMRLQRTKTRKWACVCVYVCVRVRVRARVAPGAAHERGGAVGVEHGGAGVGGGGAAVQLHGGAVLARVHQLVALRPFTKRWIVDLFG